MARTDTASIVAVAAFAASLTLPAAAAEWSAFRPIASPPPPPSVADAGRPSNPVDAFVRARLHEAGLTPAPLGDRRVWIRRVSFDLLGLPPTPEEVRAFLADSRPDPFAYAAVVDRLLAAPEYGERWARHWLDVVRYGDSDGFAIDGERPTLWRYRDYVVRTFNEDRPFDRFIREQLAGDEIDAGSEGIVATGFYRLGPYEADNMTPERRRQDYLDEVTSAVGNVFLGLTVGCARCHDHKYDPITSKDYYRLQAFFTPLKRSQVKADFVAGELSTSTERRKAAVEAELARRREKLEEHRAALKRKLAAARGKEASAISDKDLDAALKEKAEPLSDEDRKKHAQRKKAIADYKDIQRYSAVACAIENPKADAKPPATHVLLNGDVFARGDRVEPGFLSAVAPWSDALTGRVAKVAASAAGRRRVLADWIASSENPLTARVLVNRIWQYHMGTGLVATANDFGANGSGASHPELLDYLARRLIDYGWRLKPLHRLLVLSDTYRLSTTHPDREACMKVDPENRLCWRAPFRRLEAEALRDAMLAVSGRLNREKGGPGFYEALPAPMGADYPFFTWKASDARERGRRSLYMFQRRNMVHPMMEVFDAAEMTQSCERRMSSVTAPQALTLLNSAFTRDISTHLARRLRAEAGADAAGQVDHLFQLALGRPPEPEEAEACLRFLERKRANYESRGEAKDKAKKDASHVALRDLCLAVINTNEFLYLD